MGKVKEAAASLDAAQQATLRSAAELEAQKAAAKPDLHKNLHIWNRLQTTDPQFTKGFDRRGFKGTMIDPTWRMKMMTEAFGPIGIGWGWEELQQQITADCVFIQVRAWYTVNGEKVMAGAQWGGNDLYMTRKGQRVPNDEAFKMAATDALGKSLLSIGLSSDIYLGLFDDAKYREDADAYYDAKDREEKRKASEAKRGRTAQAPATHDGSRATTEDMPPIDGETRSARGPKGYGESGSMTLAEWIEDEEERFAGFKKLQDVKAEWRFIHQGVVDLAEADEDASQRLVSAYQAAVTRLAPAANAQPAE